MSKILKFISLGLIFIAAIFVIVNSAQAPGGGLPVDEEKITSSDSTSTANNNTTNVNTGVGAANVLDLSYKNLQALPADVVNKTTLTELNLSYNQLTGALPAEIRQLKNLKRLDLSHNAMTGIPAEMGQLTDLEYLDLSYNKFTGLPYELGNLSRLKTLNLAGNNYAQQDLDIIKSKLPSTTNIILQ